jgi:hypothetical protein
VPLSAAEYDAFQAEAQTVIGQDKKVIVIYTQMPGVGVVFLDNGWYITAAGETATFWLRLLSTALRNAPISIDVRYNFGRRG